MWWNLPWWYVTKIMFYGFSRDPKRRFLAFWHMQNVKTMKMAWAIDLIPHLVYPNLLNNSSLALWDRIPTSNHRSDHRNFEFEHVSIFFAASAIPVHEKWGYQCGIISKPFLKVTLRYLDIFKHRGKYSPARAQKGPLFWLRGEKLYFSLSPKDQKLLGKSLLWPPNWKPARAERRGHVYKHIR